MLALYVRRQVCRLMLELSNRMMAATALHPPPCKCMLDACPSAPAGALQGPLRSRQGCCGGSHQGSKAGEASCQGGVCGGTAAHQAAVWAAGQCRSRPSGSRRRSGAAGAGPRAPAGGHHQGFTSGGQQAPFGRCAPCLRVRLQGSAAAASACAVHTAHVGPAQHSWRSSRMCSAAHLTCAAAPPCCA